MDDNVFNSGEPKVPEAPKTPETPSDPLASILNENGEPKYKTVDDALKALAHSQAFIETLKTEKSTVESELNTLRESASKAATIEEVLKKLSAKDEPEAPKVETPPVGGLSEEAVAELVRSQLAGLESAKAQATNVEKVQNTLKQKFGEKTVEVVRAKAQELGITPEKLGELSSSSPDLVLALFGSKPSSAPTTGSVHIPNHTPQSELERPTKSLLIGASGKEQKEYMKKVKDEIYKKHGITA